MDHAVKATRGRPWNTQRFENDELESLYQRYTLNLQRFSVIGVVILVLLLCLSMAALSFSYNRTLTLHVSFTISCIISSRCSSTMKSLSFTECFQFNYVPDVFNYFRSSTMSRYKGSSSAIFMLWHIIFHGIHLLHLNAHRWRCVTSRHKRGNIINCLFSFLTPWEVVVNLGFVWNVGKWCRQIKNKISFLGKVFSDIDFRLTWAEPWNLKKYFPILEQQCVSRRFGAITARRLVVSMVRYNINSFISKRHVIGYFLES